jgi:ubiquitin carboxyl-terminal hydrolase 7
MPIRRTGPTSTISQMTQSGGMPLPPIVFYEVLEVSLVDMESKREITVNWLPDGVATVVVFPSPRNIDGQDPVTLLVSRQGTFEDIVQALVKKHTNIPTELYDRIRLFEIRGNKEYKEYQPTQALSTAFMDFSYGVNLFAEPIPLEEDEAGEHDRAVIVIHFAKEINRLHGVPIKFVVKPVSPLT